ncbi:glycosyltransferase family 2 protein [Streptomyces sp. NPDC058052]|uniref:glycosyltransferase family 2 protein n=1 Tax=Streptomyces sp. NPDC058052 TaxID=3346316 RepID=UPI0036E0C862
MSDALQEAAAAQEPPSPGPGVAELLDALPQAAALVGADRRILRVNRRFRALLRLPDDLDPAGRDGGERLLGHVAALLARPEDRDRFLAEARGHGPVTRTADHHLADGRILRRRRSPAGAGGHLLLIEDVTRQREARDDLDQRVRRLAALTDERTAFAGRALHELRTPLATVLSFAELLLDPASGPLGAEQTAYLEAILRNARRMTSIAENLPRAAGEDPALALVSGAEAFGDPDMGGVQIGVRMRNVDDERPLPGRGRAAHAYARLLIRMQDAEFAVSNTAMQLLRRRTGSVGLGGNGQFTRLTALDRIAAAERRPWQRDALLEDYELGLHMRLAGYRVTHVHATWVSQEALPYTHRFLTQRTRWAQGNISCVRYTGRIVSSRHYRARGVLESLYTFFQPIAHLATLLLTAVMLVALVVGGSAAEVVLAAWPLALVLALTSIVPFVLWGPVYRREFAPDRSRISGVLWGLALWLYAYHLFVVSARGFVRLLRGRTGWAKTRRNAETAGVGPVATES